MQAEETSINTPYHHGNVKNALVDVAMKLIETNSIEDITLRRLAKEIGITPSAVYNHFKDKDALMLAIKIRAYQKFHDYYDQYCTTQSDPVEALAQSSIAYYNFSELHPSIFRFLFGISLPEKMWNEEIAELSCRQMIKSRKNMIRVFEKFKISYDEELVVNTLILLWSHMHGLVALKNSLSIHGLVMSQGWPETCALHKDEEIEQTLRHHIDIVVSGVVNNQHKLHH